MVVGITEDVDGNIWAECASNPRKLVRIRNFRVEDEFSGSDATNAHTIAADPRGGIWLSTLAGDLVRFQNGAMQRFPLHITGHIPRQIVPQPDGSVLVAAPNDGLIGLRMEYNATVFQDQERRTQDRKRAKLHAQAKELGLQLVPVESVP
jgi:streptogramin lyase